MSYIFQFSSIFQFQNPLPSHAKLQLFKAAILPHLTYCGTAWHFCRVSDRHKARTITTEGFKNSIQ